MKILEIGKTYHFAGYDWTVCKLDNNTAVIQSHGVTHGFYLDEDLIRKYNISDYNDTMKSLYDNIKEAENKSYMFGRGLYLVSTDNVGFMYEVEKNVSSTGTVNHFEWIAAGYFLQVLKEVAKNAVLLGAASNFAWIGVGHFTKYALAVSASGDVYENYLPCGDYAIAPAFNLDVSKVDVIGNEIVIKGRSYDKTLSEVKKVKQVRLILAKKGDKQYKTVEIEVPDNIDLADYDIVGGEWL